MAAMATLEELQARLDWTLDADEERIATAALEDASDLARHYGREWPDGSVPSMARTMVLKAAARYMRNPDGYTQSRAGDETVAWNDRAGTDAGTVYFTGDEQKLLAGLAGKAKTIGSMPITAWGPQRKGSPRMEPACHVPVDYGGDPVLMFSDPVDPW